MIIYDPLYGKFQIKEGLKNLISTPEVRRLSQIRLLNTLSPTIATLGEIRRYSHTLGVLYLSNQNKLEGYSLEERKALEASILLHDIGTPPFGHLFEYHLRERNGWDHEQAIYKVLWGNHAPENRAHQIFGGKTIDFVKKLKKSSISFEIVEKIIQKEHPLSNLIFGSIDFDNLDNVIRMGWGLGLSINTSFIKNIASSLKVNKKGELEIDKEESIDWLIHWLKIRRNVYEILIFDPPTVASQAVLSKAIEIGFDNDLIGEDDWTFTDEDLINELRNHNQTKPYINEYLGYLPKLAFCFQVSGTLKDLNLKTRNEAIKHIENTLRSVFKTKNVLGYIFIDKGSFEKKILFKDLKKSNSWDIGITSSSIIFYGFIRSNQILSQKKNV